MFNINFFRNNKEKKNQQDIVEKTKEKLDLNLISLQQIFLTRIFIQK